MNDMMSRDYAVVTESRIAHLRFDQIDPNPFRDLINNPLLIEQVEQLTQSVRSTGFWHNVLVRPKPGARGRYQLAYGHARVEAARMAGLTAANFTVCDYDDETMLRMQTDENITQFGKDRFATYREATIAAAVIIMRDILAGSEKFFRPDTSGNGRAQIRAAIKAGEAPGRDQVEDFYRPRLSDGTPDFGQASTLNPGHIQAALKVWHDTGELAAWHRAHNPKAEKPKAEPTLDPEALKRFIKTDHVRTFAKAVQETQTPVAEQRKVAERIFSELAEPPGRSRTGRERYQAEEDSERRFNSRNIRDQVIKAAQDRSRSDKQRARYERLEQMTSLEKALIDFDTGLTRALNGYKRIQKVADAIGGVAETDMTETARYHAREAAKTLAELQGYLSKPMMRKLLKITHGGR